MKTEYSYFLLAGSFLVLLVSLLHVYIALAGGDLYISFGAGEDFAREDRNGSPVPMITTLFLALVFLVCSIYSYATATGRPFLPWKKTISWIIAIVFTFRGLVIFYDIHYLISFQKPERTLYPFFSLYSLAIGVLFLTGLIKNKNHDKN
ncbi:MAG: DUF3995 domain-containing protein [Bacteroidales bacterium]|nr:DUF3995 domain-containing protein [Bacteroidales bacterium]